MDIATLIGIIAGIAAVISGFVGRRSTIWPVAKTAALIVFGGTIAAVVASFLHIVCVQFLLLYAWHLDVVLMIPNNGSKN